MINRKKKLDILAFTKIFIVILVSFFCLNLLSNIFFPHVIMYLTDLNSLLQLFFNNIKIITITVVCVLLGLFIIRNIYKKIIYLFSEETTDKDIFDASEESWKIGEYEKVYDNLNYLYHSFQKNNISNDYIISTEGILLFQKSDFNDKNIDKDSLHHIINKLLIACTKLDHYLNIIHLAYCFAHLTKLEDKKRNKANYHLISSLLFYYADPILHKSEAELERRIYNYYVKNFPQLRNPILEGELKNLISEKKSSDHFQNVIVPYIEELFKENAAA